MAHVVIVHPEMGVYLGHAMGFGFWTMLDPAGAAVACTFGSEADARQHVASWVEHNVPDAYRYVPCGGAFVASISELKAAGLGPLLGKMEIEVLRYAQPAGHA